jgi:hypothetical protein
MRKFTPSYDETKHLESLKQYNSIVEVGVFDQHLIRALNITAKRHPSTDELFFHVLIRVESNEGLFSKYFLRSSNHLIKKLGLSKGVPHSEVIAEALRSIRTQVGGRAVAAFFSGQVKAQVSKEQYETKDSLIPDSSSVNAYNLSLIVLGFEESGAQNLAFVEVQEKEDRFVVDLSEAEFIYAANHNVCIKGSLPLDVVSVLKVILKVYNGESE